MSYLQTVLTWFSLVAAGVMSAVGFAVWCDQHQVFPERRLLGAFRRLPWPVQFFLLAFSLHLIVHGSMKMENVELKMENAGVVVGVATTRTASALVCAATHRTASALTGGMVTAMPSVQTPPVRALAVRCDALAVRSDALAVRSDALAVRRGAGRTSYEILQPETGRVPANVELAQNWWRRGC